MDGGAFALVHFVPGYGGAAVVVVGNLGWGAGVVIDLDVVDAAVEVFAETGFVPG